MNSRNTISSRSSQAAASPAILSFLMFWAILLGIAARSQEDRYWSFLSLPVSAFTSSFTEQTIPSRGETKSIFLFPWTTVKAFSPCRSSAPGELDPVDSPDDPLREIVKADLRFPRGREVGPRMSAVVEKPPRKTELGQRNRQERGPHRRNGFARLLLCPSAPHPIREFDEEEGGDRCEYENEHHFHHLPIHGPRRRSCSTAPRSTGC